MIYKILLGVVGLAGLVPHGVFGGLLPQTPPQTIEDGSEPVSTPLPPAFWLALLLVLYY